MAELIEYKNKWVCSYETLGFDTVDGDIDFGQYALDESGKGQYIRTKPKSEAQFDRVKLPYDVSELQEVQIIPNDHCYYDEFRDAKGKTVRIQSNAKKYWDAAQIKDYPQPERIEMVEELPPPEPEPTLPEHHSIAYDATSNSGEKSSVSSYSWSHTCTGDNGLLVVGNSVQKYQDAVPTISSVTFNGDEVTAIRTDTTDDGSGYIRTDIRYRIAPDTGGSYTVAVTLSGTADGAIGGAISYTGAAQSGQPDANNGAVGSGSPATVSVTTVADNSWVIDIVAAWESPTASINTERWDVDYYGAGGDTNSPKTPAGAQTMSWTLSAGGLWCISAASFAPADGGGPPEQTLLDYERKTRGVNRGVCRGAV